jgi:hypothetical protein
MSVAKAIYAFYTGIKPPSLPKGTAWLQPYENEDVCKLLKKFTHKYYSDKQPRSILLGINPGRFGAGITGINFTAPRQLKEELHIPHSLGNGSEISAEFIYEMIAAYGGAEKFYARNWIGSVCPLGLVKKGLNLNYYDDAALQKKLSPFIANCIQAQWQFCGMPVKCVCIGGEKNYRFLSQLNETKHWFTEIIPVPHPRFIMQYRRRQKNSFIDQYLQALRGTVY